MVEEDLGEATIVYEGPDGETEERTVENEYVAYFQDHWVVKTGEDEEGRDTIRRIPAQRVYYVEREVEQFEREVKTVYDEVQSVADEFGRGVGSIRRELGTVVEEVESAIAGTGGADESPEEETADVYRIDVESGEPVDEEDEQEASGEESTDEVDEDAVDESGAVDTGDESDEE